MESSIKSKLIGGIKRNMVAKNKQPRQVITKIEDIHDERFYRVADLQAILENLGLNYSIYTIRDYETWKCLNYECGKRSNESIEKCVKCGGPVRAPIIVSPRTLGGGKGVGHRRYSGVDLKKIIEVFKQRG